jgi:hypothetical protein
VCNWVFKPATDVSPRSFTHHSNLDSSLVIKDCVTMIVLCDELPIFFIIIIITKLRLMEIVNTPFYVGIDVSKAELVISYLDASKPNQWKKAKIANTLLAIDSWLVSFGTVTKHFVLEFTGVYSDRLIYCLNQHAALFFCCESFTEPRHV